MARDPIIPRRVVVTGIGVVTPIGSTKEAFWKSLIAGQGGVQRITRIKPDPFPTQIAAEVKDFNPEQFIDRKDLRHMDLFTQFALGAAVQAIEDSGLDFDQEDRDRIGVIVGSGIGGMYIFEEEVRVIDSKGPRRITPFFIPMMISDIIAGHISIRYNLRGPNYATTSACATSGHALGLAMREIRYGFADIVIAGGSEAPICETGVGGFCAMKALSTRNDEPEKACRPFDAQRDGFIMGEGAGILVLEEYEHAKKRGARIYAELAGAGFTGDAFHITAPPEDGNGARRAMMEAIKDAGLDITDIDYINAHGTSTPLNDVSETRAIKHLFGDHAYQFAVSSTKSMHGHLLGAAGAVEGAATILSIYYGIVPPTINYEFPDPECDLDYVPNKARPMNIKAAISNTFGFGGHNACLVFTRLSEGE